LAKCMPDRVPACSGGDVCSMMGLGVIPAERPPLAGSHQ
jgi:N-methylhydantoinase B